MNILHAAILWPHLSEQKDPRCLCMQSDVKIRFQPRIFGVNEASDVSSVGSAAQGDFVMTVKPVRQRCILLHISDWG